MDGLCNLGLSHTLETKQATINSMAPYAFLKNQEIQNFNFSKKNYALCFLRQTRHFSDWLHTSQYHNCCCCILPNFETPLRQEIQTKCKKLSLVWWLCSCSLSNSYQCTIQKFQKKSFGSSVVQPEPCTK